MTTPILPLRSTLVLSVYTLTLAALSAGFLLSGIDGVDPIQLPQALTFFALLSAALGAPYVFGPNKTGRDQWLSWAARSALAAIWCGISSGYFLLVSARIAPIEITGVIHATLWITDLAWLSIMLNMLLPRSASALLFAWIIIPPVGAYMLAEIFLTSPAGGSGLVQSTIPQAAALRSTITFLLNASPGTATFGALSGKLVDGTDYSQSTGLLALLIPTLLALLLGFLRSSKASTLTADSRAIPSGASQS